mmetsp:Transcript_1047/g.2757  ORF Transcript_1047/g.2757 Transcript_1047/m.2757 type:complete len:357 (-) Transcript_1047:585-1655(-)
MTGEPRHVLRHAGGARPDGAGSGADGGTAGPGRPCPGQQPGLHGVAGGRRCRGHHQPRRARPAAADPQEQPGCGPGRAPRVAPGRFCGRHTAAHLPVAWPAVRARTRCRRRRPLAHRACPACGGHPSRPVGPCGLQLSPDPGGRHDGSRPAHPRGGQLSRRGRQYRAAVAGPAGPAARGLCGHAQPAAHPAGEGGRGRPGAGLSAARPGQRRGLPAGAGGLVCRARRRCLPVLCDGRPGPDRLPDRSARGPGGGRGRHRRDRAPRQRRAGARGRGGRSRGDDAVARLSADPLRHRRPLRGAAGHQPLRPHQPAAARLAGPGRPVGQGARHVRACRPGDGGAGALRPAWTRAPRHRR